MKEFDFLKLELIRIQEEYKVVVFKGAVDLKQNYYLLQNCLFFIDEIKRFWLERKELLRYCWDRITDQNDCFMLSAAIYLQSASGNQYPFKAVGDLQLLPDPFIKMERFLRASNSVVETEEIERQFRSVLKDTISILENYARDFIFVDIHVFGGPPENERMETIEKGYMNFISQALQTDDVNALSLSTYEQIETALHPYILDTLIFSDSDDANLCLGERVEKFLERQKTIARTRIPENIFDKFSMAVFCLYSQAVDTILKCLSVGIYPFFRSDVPVKYFYMLTLGHPDDEIMLEFIWKSIVGYFIGKEIEQLDIAKLPFNEYTVYLQTELPYQKIVNSLQIAKEGITTCSIAEVAKTVKPVINKLKMDLCV
ncbi:hypothetical protein [Geobacter sulfurreducens]|uniref:hypothetical protein n=1 Tax=Geobacter sulfurreducens TaxID=35554 RepID=UPI000DBB8549|nr:hypothetical protein [Geobacter sulfurreducens]BBA69299.1 hypothetical protein YM18_0751 [Geobacter sulfurreducens]